MGIEIGGTGSSDSYDITIARYNLPMGVVPQDGSGLNCASVGCSINMSRTCPYWACRDISAFLACHESCDAFTEEMSNKSILFISRLFKQACPTAVYGYDTTCQRCMGDFNEVLLSSEQVSKEGLDQLGK
ncbi:hypothetical protein Leryth_024427 [Lithospermum erythrorhizon]|nr:hypothetical protein Leryth_024427 [Lithospermum erythrorhizon]